MKIKKMGSINAKCKEQEKRWKEYSDEEEERFEKRSLLIVTGQNASQIKFKCRRRRSDKPSSSVGC